MERLCLGACRAYRCAVNGIGESSEVDGHACSVLASADEDAVARAVLQQGDSLTVLSGCEGCFERLIHLVVAYFGYGSSYLDSESSVSIAKATVTLGECRCRNSF